jgi:hypothetical protein
MCARAVDMLAAAAQLFAPELALSATGTTAIASSPQIANAAALVLTIETATLLEDGGQGRPVDVAVRLHDP